MISWSAEIAAAKRELKTLVERRLAQLFLWTLTAKSSAIGDNDAVESSDEGQDPGAPATESKSQRTVVRVQPFGFNGVAPTKLRGLTLRLGMSNLLFIGIGPTQAYGPQNQDVGEVSVYNVTKALIRLWKTGKLTIDADTGQDVVVNSGTLKVARDSDPVNIGTLAGTAPVGGGPVTFTFTPTNADGTPGTPVAGATVTIVGVISNSGGAAHFKA